MVFLKEVCPWNEFESWYLVLTVLGWKSGVNFFTREFLEVFYFPSDFIVVAENFLKWFLRSFNAKFFQLLGIEPSVCLYVFYGCH